MSATTRKAVTFREANERDRLGESASERRGQAAPGRMKPFDGRKRAASYESRVGARKVWTEALAGLSIGSRWQPDTSRSGRLGGNMATKLNAQAWPQIVDGPVP